MDKINCVVLVVAAICAFQTYNVDAVNCYVTATQSSQSCNFCQTNSLIMNGQSTQSALSCAPTCTAVNVAPGQSGPQVSCCNSGDYCNGNPGSGQVAQPGTFSCYVGSIGTSSQASQTQSGCVACQKSGVSIGVNVFTKKCVLPGDTCVQSGIGSLAGTYCCTANLCNTATRYHVSLLGAFVLSMVALFFRSG